MRQIILLAVLAILGACYGREAPAIHVYDYPGKAIANCVVAGWQVGTAGHSACVAGEAAKTWP
ncbi:MAG: hypothetical protein JWL84_6486 [Rhodospirillales bacterium]|nr:hypothetical protein [Rhodospirillales bacterium]